MELRCFLYFIVLFRDLFASLYDEHLQQKGDYDERCFLPKPDEDCLFKEDYDGEERSCGFICFCIFG